ncbi:hypothetical protein [Streptomyces sp. NPDC005548]|uniref:hypothetical protein n=1 Tax=Streptomyces sp. NPDC005548 TaxID=3364724 RepID=UPI0036762FB2
MTSADGGETYDTLVQELVAELAALRIRAGNPSLRDIQKRAEKLFAGEGVSLAPSTVSGLLNGGYPSRERLLWLVRTLMSWDRTGEECQPPGNGAPELDPWHNRWEAITHARPARQRQGSGPKPAVAEVAASATKPSPAPVVAVQQRGNERAVDHFQHVQRPGQPAGKRPRLRRAVVYVHDIGATREHYEMTFNRVYSRLSEKLPGIDVRGCFWGQESDPRYGMHRGRLTGFGSGRTIDEDEAAWRVTRDDPRYELRLLGLRPLPSAGPGRRKKRPQKLLAELSRYAASPQVRTVFQEHGLGDSLDTAVQTVFNSSDLRAAVSTTDEDGDEHRRAFARAVVATALAAADPQGINVSSRNGRDALLSSLFADLLERKDTEGSGSGVADIFRRQRGDSLSALMTRPVGDMLRYQARGHPLRRLIRQTIETTSGDVVTVIAFGFGSVACVDLMVQEQISRVDQLITVSTPAPYLYDIGALTSLEPSQPLPDHFPHRWLNLYDRRDLLAFSASQVFPNCVTDHAVDNGQPFPETHTAYWSNPDVWSTITTWMN